MSIFGSSGIRGSVGSEFTVELALNIGKAVGKRYRRIIIGKDTRTSGDMVENALAAGAMAAGADVHVAGIVSTPTLARAAFDFDCGLMVTASHNPAEYNGVKMWNPDGSAFNTPQMEEVENCIGSSKLKMPDWKGVGTMHRFEGATQNHIQQVLHSVGSAHLNVVLDCGCGATCGISPFLLRGDGMLRLHDQRPARWAFPRQDAGADGWTSLWTCAARSPPRGPTWASPMMGTGTAWWPSTRTARFVDGDKLLALFASLSEAGGIVAPIDASMVLDDIVDGNVVRTRVGDGVRGRSAEEAQLPVRRGTLRNVHLPQGDILS